ncbi:50S ribosomal protein L31 [Candidatus Vidania fulgoroideorum]
MKEYKTIFKDKITGKKFILNTTFKSSKKKKYKGKKIRFVEIDISSYSHPYFKDKKHKKKVNERINKFVKFSKIFEIDGS